MARQTEDVIRELATDLAPVKPLGRIREIILTALGASLPFYVYVIATSGIGHQFSESSASDAAFLIVAGALVFVALGGLLAGLSSAIPGREDTSRMGGRLFMIGVGIGVAGFVYYSLFGATTLAAGAQTSLNCVLGSGLLAIPAAFLVARFIFHGAAAKIPRALALAGAGGMGAAAAVVHATCRHPEPIHFMLGHALAPVFGGLLVLLCVSAFFYFHESRDNTSTH